MRTSLIAIPRRAASTVCSACRRREAFAAAGTGTGISLSVSTSRPISTRASTAVWPAAPLTFTSTSSSPRRNHHTPRANQQPRWLSSSSGSSPSPFKQEKIIPKYYALFPETLPLGPPPSGPFEVDVRALRREFLRLQAAAHPDFHHSASSQSAATERARKQAETASALINQAFKTLSSPLLRAQYLLAELAGMDLVADEAGSDSGAGAEDPELLMTVLEAREAIEEAKSERDLEEVKEANEVRIQEAETNLTRAFKMGNFEGAREEAVRLRYWYNIREGIDNWEPGKPMVLQH